ncbi:MBL fold metallo-hydrolase [soil metagenome]
MTNGAGFHEVADRVWVARYPWFDVNITLVAGSDGAVVVDTHASEVAVREVIDDLSRVAGLGRIVGVVNTHEHFDHTFGNATLLDAFGVVPIHAHEVAAARTAAAGERIKRRYVADLDDPHRAEVLATRVVPADHTFSSATTLDLGDRLVELSHPGRGHTGGDVVVWVPDADVLLAGDLVEESAPPAIGDDAYPLDWPQSLDVLLGSLGTRSVVVPGHGAVVDRAFVQRQRTDLGVVVETIRSLVERGVAVTDAFDAAEWPWPHEVLEAAIRRGYDQVGRTFEAPLHRGRS